MKHVKTALKFFLVTLILLSCKNESKNAPSTSAVDKTKTPPNIVIIYTDDLGFGDIGPYGATAVKIPQLDALAKEGIVFKNAYATAATCTPSHYSLLTGNYAWRREGTGVAKGDESLLIDPANATLPSMLKATGYETGIVGKWHLGLGGKVGPTGTEKLPQARWK